MLNIVTDTVQSEGRSHFWGPVGKLGPTIEISLIFLECVRDKGTTDQLVIGSKMAGITDSISLDNPSIRAEEIIRPGPDWFPLACSMPSVGHSVLAVQLEVAAHIYQPRGCQTIGYLHIPIRLQGVEVEIEIPH